MCGIAAFSLHPRSRVNARRLAHELLVGIEDRGNHASGFAYARTGGEFNVYKDAIPGSQLPLGLLPRKSRHVILHTRYATQGAVSDNRNNHPVIGPEGHIALAHNGVISNDFDFRLGLFENTDLPAVDSAVIPALMEVSHFSDAIGELEGYAALTWIDSRDPKPAIHITRVDYSPVAYTWLTDGSFVMASTETILAKALNRAHCEYGHIFSMAEGDYVRVEDGVIMDALFDITMQEDYYTRSRFASATAGGHASASEGYTGTNFGIGSTFFNGVDDDEADSMSWEDDYRARAGLDDDDDVAMAFGAETNGAWAKGEDGVWRQQGAGTKSEYDSDFSGYYIAMEDGSVEHFLTLEDMEAHLSWLANMGLYDGAPFPEVEHTLKWINFIQDLGSITKNGAMESWLEDMARIDEHDLVNPAMYTLGYIREGASMLLETRGR